MKESASKGQFHPVEFHPGVAVSSFIIGTDGLFGVPFTLEMQDTPDFAQASKFPDTGRTLRQIRNSKEKGRYLPVSSFSVVGQKMSHSATDNNWPSSIRSLKDPSNQWIDIRLKCNG